MGFNFLYIFSTNLLMKFNLAMSKRKNNTMSQIESKKPKVSGHWSMGLLKTMEDPKSTVYTDNLVTVIKDAYPKAEFHYLVLPKQDLSNLKKLTEVHVDLLKHMEKVGRNLIDNEEHKHRKFRFGYHSEASMFRLHLHVISEDMNSPCLKNKKHWNSFTTKFFLDSDDVIKCLESDGKVKLPSREICKNYMEAPLKCHKCEYAPKNLPDLKKHILSHL